MILNLIFSNEFPANSSRILTHNLPLLGPGLQHPGLTLLIFFYRLFCLWIHRIHTRNSPEACDKMIHKDTLPLFILIAVFKAVIQLRVKTFCAEFFIKIWVLKEGDSSTLEDGSPTEQTQRRQLALSACGSVKTGSHLLGSDSDSTGRVNSPCAIN